MLCPIALKPEPRRMQQILRVGTPLRPLRYTP
jgi:hypothetical protein